MAKSGNYILMAIIGKAQGLAGQMRLKFFGDTAESLRQYSVFYGKDGAEYRVNALHLQQNLPLIALAGVETRSQAEALAGTELYIKRAQLAETLAADEFYHHDLLGLAVFAETGEHIGAVSGFFNFGGGDLLEVTLLPPQPAEAKTAAAKAQGKARGRAAPKVKKELIPFSKAAVPQLDLASGRLIVNRLAAGLAPAEADAETAAEAAAAAPQA